MRSVLFYEFILLRPIRLSSNPPLKFVELAECLLFLSSSSLILKFEEVFLVGLKGNFYSSVFLKDIPVANYLFIFLK